MDYPNFALFGVPPNIYAFHRYTRNSAYLSGTQDGQFQCYILLYKTVLCPFCLLMNEMLDSCYGMKKKHSVNKKRLAATVPYIVINQK